MKGNVTKVLLILSLYVVVFGSGLLNAQSAGRFQYINPLPGSKYVSINSNVIVRKRGIISRSGIYDNLIEAEGAKSGIHRGKVVLAKDSRTLIFIPFVPFQIDEDVTVILRDGLTTENGIKVGTLSFSFHTSKNEKTLITENLLSSFKNMSKIAKNSSVSVSDTMLPSNLPGVVINTSNGPSPGYFFLSASPYLEIIDNEGTPVFYKNVEGHVYDFDLQPDGELTYFIYPVTCYGLNSSFKAVRTFKTANGYSVDVHDLRVLPDGSYYIFGKKVIEMDLSNIVSGGDTAARIIDGALQEFDSDGNLLFQWDALDHYNITDVDKGVDLTQHTIDFAHFNSVAFDVDGNLLISARNLDEITKVNHNTGDIIWRWGGKNNQFTFINDTLGFSGQHDIRLLSNGNVSLFDNGVFRSPQVSSAVEYKLDEIYKTAALVRRTTYNHNIFTTTEGSYQEIPNGNRLISWGHNWNPFITEIKPDNSIAIDMSYSYFIDTYRAFKYQWQTGLFTTNIDSLNFGEVAPGGALTKRFTIYNPHKKYVTISEFFCRDSSFTIGIEVPVTIRTFDSLIVPVTFEPTQKGAFSASLNIRNFGRDGYQQMIARQVVLSGTAGDVTAVSSGSKLSRQFMVFQNYPNPFNPSTTITYEIPVESFVTLKIYDVLGRLVKTLINEEKPPGKYSVIFHSRDFSNGIYFYKLKAGNYTEIKKMVLLK